MKDQGTKLTEALSKLEQLKDEGIDTESLAKSIREKANNNIINK